MRADRQYDIPEVPGYTPWSTERRGSDKGGGGLTLLYKSDLPVHKHEPNVPDQFQYVKQERQWLLFGTGCKKIAFLHCYLACQSSRDNTFIQWNSDLLFLLGQEAQILKRQGFVILALGDFNTRVGRLPGLEGNSPDVNQNYPLFMNFLQETNMMIVNTLPISKGLFTWFNDNISRPGTKSLLDYCLVDPAEAHNISSFVIDDQARFRVGSDHALLECTFKFGGRQPRVLWNYKDIVYYNINEATNYQKYVEELDSCISSIPMTEFEQLNTCDMLKHITEHLNNCAQRTIGVRVAKKKRGRRLPPSILALIRQKSDLVREVSSSGTDTDGIKAQKEGKIKGYRCMLAKT